MLQDVHLMKQKTNLINYYRGIVCVKNCCEKLRDCPMEIINYEKQEMIQLTNEENKSYKKQKVCKICKK